MTEQQLAAWLTQHIADKSKTGRQELLYFIWALAGCYENVLRRDFAQLEDKQWVELPIAHEQVQKVGKAIVHALVDEVTKIDYKSPPCEKRPISALCTAVFNGFLTPADQQDLLLKMVRILDKALPNLDSFKVNLLLINYHISKGYSDDQNAESVNCLQGLQKQVEINCRPFASILPDYIRVLLPVFTISKQHLLPYNKSAVVSFSALPDKSFVPPALFNVDFPIDMAAKHQDVKYHGSRLSYGHYNIEPEFLRAMHSILKDCDKQTLDKQQQNGDISLGHIKRLVGIFSRRKVSLDLAVDWAKDVSNMVLGLIDALSHLQVISDEFLNYLKGRVANKLVKLDDILAEKTFGINRRKEKDENQLSAFDRVELLDANLWEFLVLTASGLSLIQLKKALRFIDRQWQPNVYVGSQEGTVADVQLQDELVYGQIQMVRTLFSSGVLAEDGLRRVLKMNGCEVLEPNLGENQRIKASDIYEVRKVQVWMKLCDDIHRLLLDADCNKVAERLAGHILAQFLRIKQSCQSVVFEQAVLVVDYSRFSAELPSNILYPILLQFVETLKAHKFIVDVMLFRTNHHYHVGVIDRYQSGEVLSSGQLSMPINTQLLGNANGSFNSADPQLNAWQLRGQYVPLMKRCYLLADFVLQRRVYHYEALYRRVDVIGDKKAQAMWFFECRLAEVFGDLVSEIENKRFNSELPNALRKRVVAFWRKLSGAKDVIERFNPLHADILNLQVDEFIEFIKVELKGIAKDFDKLKLRTVHDRHSKISLGSYRLRILSMADKLYELG